MNIVLCGMMGAGKTTVGIQIARKTGRRWFDTDEMIENAHGKISDIFEYYGEEYFRKIESEILSEFDGQDGIVVSTGGGLVLKKENNERLKKNGKIVFLRATFDTLLNRLKINENRPLLQGQTEMVEAKLKELLILRTPIYESVADYIVDVDHKTPEETANDVIGILKGENKEGGNAQ